MTCISRNDQSTHALPEKASGARETPTSHSSLKWRVSFTWDAISRLLTGAEISRVHVVPCCPAVHNKPARLAVLKLRGGPQRPRAVKAAAVELEMMSLSLIVAVVIASP